MLFTVYSKLTGQILYCGECSDPTPLENETNALIIEKKIQKVGWLDDDTFVQQPESPSKHCVFDWEKKQWVDPRTSDTQWPIVRAERNQRLQATDWTDTASASARLGQELYDQWQTYRQALRDVTEQPDPFNIVWPTAPTA